MIAHHTIQGKIFRLIQGDLTHRDVDAIVNAANSSLRHGGGVAGAIVRKGGQSIQDESDKIGYVPAGHAAITGAGRLPAKFVIHAVGPRMGEGDEDNKLRRAVISSLQLASEKKLGSISFPAIGSGIFGFPKDKAAVIFMNTIQDYFEQNPKLNIKLVRLVIIDQPTYQVFTEQFQRSFSIK